MIYVLSDIHGNKQKFDSIMEQINLKDSDLLYILGDVVDRYPYGITILNQIIDMPNVKMLLGNHEYMMMRALGFPYDDDIIPDKRKKLTRNMWYLNGGEVTDKEWAAAEDNTKRRIIDYLKSVPLNYNIEVNGKKYKLIHAAAEEWYDKYGNKSLDTKTYFAVWYRDAAQFDEMTDYSVIFGHTPTIRLSEENPPKIWYSGNKIGIDCACGYIKPKRVPKSEAVKGRLACLRLDDMKEFYSE